ncbi:MAG: metallophosphoesterase [Clostridia bacterium]|nr:metallophosphoesterase [Clostridia bacterium]
MLTTFVAFVRALLSAVMIFSTVLAPVTGDRYGKIKRAKDDCNASFAVISDTHLKDNFIREGMLDLGLDDMADAKDRLDAVVFDGDITDNSQDDMWDCFARAVSNYDIADQKILVIGNHDTWGHEDENGEDDPEAVRQTFIKYNRQIAGRELENVYYSTEINGYPVIVLGSEGCHTSATVSQTQIDWFAQEMEKASQTGLPIFVFMHQPINHTHGLPYTWSMDANDPPDKGGIGDASDDILDIIRQYKNVFFISGHIHEGFSKETDRNPYVSVEKYNNYTLVNVPCYMYMDFLRGGNLTNGTGYVFEVYDGSVLIRARNFATSTWCSRYDVEIPLVNEEN